MLGANGVVAAGLPIAVGAAHSVRIRGGREIVACFFGDGAINRGPFAESLNWAQVFLLPVLFVCEDNRWSATTPTRTLTAGEGAAARALSYGIPALTVDGNDVEAVDAAAAALAAEIRAAADRACCTRSPTASKAMSRSIPPPTAIRTSTGARWPTIRCRAPARGCRRWVSERAASSRWRPRRGRKSPPRSPPRPPQRHPAPSRPTARSRTAAPGGGARDARGRGTTWRC